MKRNVAITFMVLATIFVYSAAWTIDSRQVWLANSPVLTIRNGAGGYTIEQRVRELQQRVNDLMQFGGNTPMFTTIKSGTDCNIYADNKFFMTVTKEDARANQTTPGKLASVWINRLNTIIPKVISLYKPITLNIDQSRIPNGTVIRVTLDRTLDSATSKVGDSFYAYQQDMSAVGFPQHTEFLGKVGSVTRASLNTAGQIGISFVKATLPNGISVPIVGQLTALDESSVRMDPITSRLMGTIDSGTGNQFIASGAGAGLAIGQTLGSQPFVGAVFGAGEGYLYDQKQIIPAIGKDVQILAGTGFGILLNQDVVLPNPEPPSPRDILMRDLIIEK